MALAVPMARRVEAQDSAKTYQGLTRPSRDVDLVLRVSGVLARLPVVAGQEVKKGEVIAELKSELERQSLDIARVKAESNHEIRLAETELKLKQTELRQFQELEAKQAASKWEVETTTVEVELREVLAETARFNKQLAGLEYRREQLLLAERKLLAPFDGVILRTLKEEGEGVADLEPIAVLVRLDPMWVECHLPPDLFSRVHVGTRAVVQVACSSPDGATRPDDPSGDAAAVPVIREGVVVAADPLVDAASNTFRVVIEVPNSDGTFVAGVLATASFPDNVIR
ncbi:MAG: efflux RND transporter periplasmic adaptor subunit [Phycisphaerae bacterium]